MSEAKRMPYLVLVLLVGVTASASSSDNASLPDRLVQLIADNSDLHAELADVAGVSIRSLDGLTGLRAIEIWTSEDKHALTIHDGSAWLAPVELPTSFELGDAVMSDPYVVTSHPYLDATRMYQRPAWGLVFMASSGWMGNNASGGNSYSLLFVGQRDRKLELLAVLPLGGEVWSRAMIVGRGYLQAGTHSVLCPSVTGARLDLSLACQRVSDPRTRPSKDLGENCARARRGQCRPTPAWYPLGSNALTRRRVGSYAPRGDRFVRWTLRDKVMTIAELAALVRKDNEAAGAREIPAPRLVVSERPYGRKDEPIDWLEVENLMGVPVDLQGATLADPWDPAPPRATVQGVCVVSPSDVVVLRRGEGPSWLAGPNGCFFGDIQLKGNISIRGEGIELADSGPTDQAADRYSRQRDRTGRECFRAQSEGLVNVPCE